MPVDSVSRCRSKTLPGHAGSHNEPAVGEYPRPLSHVSRSSILRPSRGLVAHTDTGLAASIRPWQHVWLGGDRQRATDQRVDALINDRKTARAPDDRLCPTTAVPARPSASAATSLRNPALLAVAPGHQCLGVRAAQRDIQSRCRRELRSPPRPLAERVRGATPSREVANATVCPERKNPACVGFFVRHSCGHDQLVLPTHLSLARASAAAARVPAEQRPAKGRSPCRCQTDRRVRAAKILDQKFTVVRARTSPGWLVSARTTEF